jgi:hypothetical protein
MNRRRDADQIPAPWDTSQGSDWLASLDPWLQTTRLIHGTLKMDTTDHYHEIRAAASMVIMFCRENLWPIKDDSTREEILELASRQLSNIKQLYEYKARSNPKLKTNPSYRSLLTSLDEEIRIIEARMSDDKPMMPGTPPTTWGDFWT